MVVYVDILIFINIIVNYLLIRLTTVILKLHTKGFREVISAIIGALFSVYIFLPKQFFFIELLMRILPAFTIVLIAYGYHNLKSFLRKISTFYLVSFLYAGLMMGAWLLFKPQKMSINNGIVYFDISPLLLLTASVVFYLIIYFFKKVTEKNSEIATRCNITIALNDLKINCIAMVDTGHTLNDIFGNSVVFVIDKNISNSLIGAEDTVRIMSLVPPINKNICKCFRLIPVKTISGEKMLPAIKVDSLVIEINKKERVFNKSIAVISEDKLGDDFSAILPANILNEG